jgi:hypothetical protein
LVGCGGDTADSSVSGGAVTEEAVFAKAEAVQKRILELGQSDPEKLLKITQEIQTKLPELQNANDLSAIYKFYDEMLELMK